MVNKANTRPVVWVLGMIMLQVLLPFIVSVCQVCIKEMQEHKIARYGHNLGAYKKIIVSDEVQVRDGDELLYRGEIYDVAIYKHDSHGKLIAYVLPDDDETALQRFGSDIPVKDKLRHGSVYSFPPFFFLFYEDLPKWAVHQDLIEVQYSITRTERTTDPFLTSYLPPPRCLQLG